MYSPSGGILPPQPPEQALRPGSLCGTSSPSVPRGEGAPPLRPRVTFSSMRKSPKNLPEGDTPLGTPRGGIIIPPATQALLRPERGATPGSTQKPNPPAAPRIDSRGCELRCSLRRNKDRFAHQPKVANRSIFVAETLSRGCGNRRGSGSEKCFTFRSVPLGGPGVPLWRAFGDFPRDGKVPRGRRGGASSTRGECRGGSRGYQPLQKTLRYWAK